MWRQQDQVIPIPSTTASTIVFPFKRRPKTFETGFYSPELTDDQVSLEEVNQFFSKIHSAFHSPLSKEDQRRLNEPPLLRLYLTGPLSILILVIIQIHFEEVMTLRETLILVIIWSNSVGLSLIWNWINEGFKPYPVILEFEKCQDIVDEYNETLQARGFKWRLPDQFPHWIELTKDLEKRANEVQAETEEKMIFSLKRGRFSKDFYSPEMTNGRISHEEMYQMISKINADLRRPFPRLNPKWLAFCLVLDIVILILVQINIYVPVPWNFLIGYALLGSFALIFIRCPALFEFGYQKKLKVDYTADFQRYMSELNETLRGRGLRWHLPKEFPDSIELLKDYKNQKVRTVDLSLDNQKSEENEEVENQKAERNFKNNLYAPLLDNKNDKKYE